MSRSRGSRRTRRDELAPLLELARRAAGGRPRRRVARPASRSSTCPTSTASGPSTAPRVDALLPRIDAVAWVVDPEKYDDERLHAYLRRMAPHAPRLRFVLNKADRLTDAQRDELAGDLRRAPRRSRHRGAAHRRSSRRRPATGSMRCARSWRAEADAKALVIGEADDRCARGAALARAGGRHRPRRRGYRPLIDDATPGRSHPRRGRRGARA